ncbi:hypothetical protein ACFPL7_11465 [Dongia soli]|uniref:Uncharacterized protein n=1 Tax=Dongia soli TaxID=600628 RepID=A0ABU5ECF3_9PROT|nr:hypothetical protein [Dongia soli]MDY0883567.1 hypothetical protein [Dongia soli]
MPDGEYEAGVAMFDQKQLTDLTIAFDLMNAYNRMAQLPQSPAATKQ